MMNLIEELKTRRLSFKELVFASWILFKSQAATLILFYLACSFAASFSEWGTDTLFSRFDEIKVVLGSVLETLIMSFFLFIVAISVETCIYDQKKTTKELFDLAGSRWLANILSLVVFSVFIHVGLLLLVVPGIIEALAKVFAAVALLKIPGLILFIFFWCAPYLMALRNMGGKAAFAKSMGMVKGHWWEIFGMLFCLSLVLAGIPNLLINNIISFSGAAAAPLSILLMAAPKMILGIAQTLFFLNLDFEANPSTK